MLAGKLEGVVTLRCPPGATGCAEGPYEMGLVLDDLAGGQMPIALEVSGNGGFSISVAPGTYTIRSGDVRGACCLPILRPMTVTILPGRTTHVSVRFEPGPQLPTR